MKLIKEHREDVKSLVVYENSPETRNLLNTPIFSFDSLSRKVNATKPRRVLARLIINLSPSRYTSLMLIQNLCKCSLLSERAAGRARLQGAGELIRETLSNNRRTSARPDRKVGSRVANIFQTPRTLLISGPFNKWPCFEPGSSFINELFK